jgi:hypothetical protein
MYRKLVFFIVLMSFFIYLAGCTSTRYLSKDELSEVKQESPVWITMADGTRYEMKEPKVEGSRLVGYIEGEGYREISFSEIDSLSTGEPDPGKSALLVFVGIAGAIILSLVLYDALFCST